jgi:serine/threonine-protein kinase
MRRLGRTAWFLLRIGIGLALGVGVYDRVVMTLVVRHGTDTIVPTVVGRRVEDGRRLLAEAELRPGTIQEVADPYVPAGEIVNQEPPAGSTVRRERAVNLLVSKGAAARLVPNLVGLTRRLAQLELSQRGLRLGRTTSVNAGAPTDDQILATRPQPGALAEEDGRIDLLVSGGMREDLYVMPDLRGVRLSEAVSMLRVIGVSVAHVDEELQIWRQDPAPGEAVRSGATAYLD